MNTSNLQKLMLQVEALKAEDILGVPKVEPIFGPPGNGKTGSVRMAAAEIIENDLARRIQIHKDRIRMLTDCDTKTNASSLIKVTPEQDSEILKDDGPGM